MHSSRAGLDWEKFRNCRLWLLVTLLWMVAASASAQTAPGDKAMAEALFDRGLTLMRQGQFAEACAQLEQSQTIEHGIGTLLYLAECYEKLGRTASAWAMFREAASAARAEGQPDRAKTGNARAERLEAQLSKLTIHVPNDSAMPGLMVLRNGQPLPSGAWGVALPMDPGEQRIEARAPGRVSWVTVVNLPPNGATLSVDVPELAGAPASSPPLPAASAPLQQEAPAQPAIELPAPSAATAAAPAPAPTRSTWQKPLGIVLGGAGVVALGLGTYFGLHAMLKNSDLERECPGTCTSTHGRDLNDQAHTAAAWSNVFVVSGLALAAAGVVLYVTAPDEHALHVALRSGVGVAQIELGGRL
jgi:hypothetical protein